MTAPMTAPVTVPVTAPVVVASAVEAEIKSSQPQQREFRSRPRSSSLQKYRRVDKPRESTPDDEIRVMGSGRVPRYVAYAAKLLTEQGKLSLTIRATGKAIAIAVSVCEVVKRRFAGLHQETTIGWTEITDEYEPIETGLERRIEKRIVPSICILLAKDESLVDKKAPGYQEPLDASCLEDDSDALMGIGSKPRRMARRPRTRQRMTAADHLEHPSGEEPQQQGGAAADPSKKPERRKQVRRNKRGPRKVRQPNSVEIENGTMGPPSNVRAVEAEAAAPLPSISQNKSTDVKA